MKKIIVTGGSRGIGLAITQHLAADGYHVVVLARTLSDDLNALIETRANVSFVAVDLHKTEEFPTVVRGIRTMIGPVYGLVNNAGVGHAGILASQSSSVIEETIRLNITAPILMTKQVIRSMMAQQPSEGRIINLSSIVASTGYSGLSTYSATKAAMIGFTRSLAREVGALGITVNAIAPGFVDTEMTHDLNPKQREQIKRRSALQRMVTPVDIAATVSFLLSEAARNITGTVLTVDAGNTA